MKILIIPVSLLFLIYVTSHVFSHNNNILDDTCQSFIQSVEDADETRDQTRPDAYSDVAENIYAALNNVVVEVGLPALPLSPDAKSREKRSMSVLKKCRADTALEYHNAAADAYVELRKAAGLPTKAQ